MARSFLDPVYPLTHSAAALTGDHAALAHLFLQAGSRFFQVRAKSVPDRDLLETLRSIKQECEEYGARFVVNDRCDLAWAAGTAGVHLGQTDMPVDLARRLLGPSAIIGGSTHTERQFLEMIEQPVDYVAVGPIFPTFTKESPHPTLGLEQLARLVRRTALPVVAIGGITLANVERIWECGACSAAVVSDILNAPDPSGRIRDYLALAVKHRAG